MKAFVTHDIDLTGIRALGNYIDPRFSGAITSQRRIYSSAGRPATSKYMPHQGKREMARRAAQ